MKYCHVLNSHFNGHYRPPVALWMDCINQPEIVEIWGNRVEVLMMPNIVNKLLKCSGRPLTFH